MLMIRRDCDKYPCVKILLIQDSKYLEQIKAELIVAECENCKDCEKNGNEN